MTLNGQSQLRTRFSVHAVCCEGQSVTWTKPCDTSVRQTVSSCMPTCDYYSTHSSCADDATGPDLV